MKIIKLILLFLLFSSCIFFQSRDDKIIDKFDPSIPAPKIEEDYITWEKYKKNIENEKLDIKKVRILIFKLNKAIIEKDFDLFFSLFQENFSLKWYYSGADLRKEELRSIFNEFNSFPESKINSLASKMTPLGICDNPIPENGKADFYRYLFYSQKIIWKSVFNKNKFIQYESYRTILFKNPNVLFVKVYLPEFGDTKIVIGTTNEKGKRKVLFFIKVRKGEEDYRIEEIEYGNSYYDELYSGNSF